VAAAEVAEAEALLAVNEAAAELELDTAK
jgi:hypothetical protein